MAMKSLHGSLKQLSPLLLPFVVIVLVPFIILYFYKIPLTSYQGILLDLQFAIGLILIVAGLCGLAWTIGLFTRVGEGTLAPWDPTKKLVVRGPYAYARNPMITSVIAVLVGEAFLLSSWSILLWAVTVFLVNHIYFIFSEEPGLEKRFEEEYEIYKKNVPRWLPRLNPWKPAA
jgi:protein-S-isoprenylcysteine O-methyltransferase Ste14